MPGYTKAVFDLSQISMKKDKNKTYKPFRLSPTHQLILAVLLFIIVAAASRAAAMSPWEVSVFQAIYNLPDFLQPAFFIVTQTGSIHAAGLILLFYLFKKRNYIAAKLLLTTLLAYLVTGFAKDIWGRARPNELLIGVVNLDYTVRGPGFPSGHVAMATALALVVGHYLPKKYRWIVPVWIVGVGLSRVYLGVHAPLDIIGGFAIGWASYALFCHVRIYNAPAAKKQPKKKIRSNALT